MFKKVLGSDVKWVQLNDPYLCAQHQIKNLLRFCEMIVKHCENLKRVDVLTKSTEDMAAAERVCVCVCSGVNSSIPRFSFGY